MIDKTLSELTLSDLQYLVSRFKYRIILIPLSLTLIFFIGSSLLPKTYSARMVFDLGGFYPGKYVNGTSRELLFKDLNNLKYRLINASFYARRYETLAKKTKSDAFRPYQKKVYQLKSVRLDDRFSALTELKAVARSPEVALELLNLAKEKLENWIRDVSKLYNSEPELIKKRVEVLLTQISSKSLERDKITRSFKTKSKKTNEIELRNLVSQYDQLIFELEKEKFKYEQVLQEKKISFRPYQLVVPPTLKNVPDSPKLRLLGVFGFLLGVVILFGSILFTLSRDSSEMTKNN